MGFYYMLGKHIDRFILIHVIGPRQERAQTPVLKNRSGYQTRDLWYSGWRGLNYFDQTGDPNLICTLLLGLPCFLYH